MLSVRACQTFLLLTALTAAPALASGTAHRATASGRHHHKFFSRRGRHHFVPGQRGIDSDRAREIQTALIKQKYMTGSPSGQWDATTESAMQKYQADHGWQTKLTPDSRALIALGLGPSQPAGTAAAAEAAPSTTVSAPAPNTLASTHVIQN